MMNGRSCAFVMAAFLVASLAALPSYGNVPGAPLDGLAATFAQQDQVASQLEVVEIKVYKYNGSAPTDQHAGQTPLLSALNTSQIVISSLTKNQNHVGEHFDYITEVFDSEGVVVYLDVRYGIAVPQGGQLVIDSGLPLTLAKPGNYTLKILTWMNLDTDPISLSSGGSTSFKVLDGNTDEAPEVPNIVVIMADDLDQRALDIILEKGLMPNLKADIVDQGVTFKESFATYPLCCPSRATFLTGQYPHNHNVWNNDLPLGGVTKLNDSSTIATWLQDAGYDTHFVGKYLNRYGQDTPEEYIPPGWNDWQATVGGSTYRMYSYRINDNGAIVKYGEAESDYQTDVLSKRAVQVINEAESADSTPFFLYLNPLSPHNDASVSDCELNYGSVGSTLPPARYAGVTADIPLPKPPSFNEADVDDKPRALQHPLLDDTQIQCLDDLFHARLDTMLAADDMIGDVMKALSENGELSDTVVIFVSDNGFMLGEHRLHGKQYVYEESIRVPLYIRAPGVAPKTIDRMVLNNDLAPTFLEFAKAKADIPVDGRSLVPLINDPGVAWRNGFLIEDNLYNGLRTETYVYSYNHNSGAQEIYDLVNDPYQLQNVKGTSSWASRITAIDQWRLALAGCEGTECESLENQVPP